jgi:hypothetical protein
VLVVQRCAALASANWMGIVEPHQPLAVRPVQCQRIVEAVRFLQGCRHTRHREPDPVAALRVHDEYLSVEFEQQIEAGVACHVIYVITSR